MAEVPLESEDEIVLLKRAEPTPVYDKQEERSGHSYGAKRRSLQNIEKAAEELREQGKKISIYEPAYDDLREQAKRFNQSETVIGIRGAELANIFWMKPGSRIIVIDNFPGKASDTSLARELAIIFEVNYELIKIAPDPHPRLEGALLDELSQIL